jgi:dienelactone hydrolase
VRPGFLRALAIAAALALAGSARADFVPGSTSDPVACAERPGESYALYLPPSWSAGRAFPILYVLDVRGRGVLALEVFRSGAARLGFIVASSNTSSTGVEATRNAASLDAMWRDTHARLRLDAARRFVAGFSGTARFAALAALAYRGGIAGVLGAGAGFPERAPPSSGMPFAYFGAVGDEDFNLAEMRALGRRLDEIGAPHRIAVFEGGHRWPPPAVADEGLEWLAACASSACPKPADASSAAPEKRRREAEEDERDLHAISALGEKLGAILRKDPVPSPERAASDLRMAGLKKRAAEVGSADAKAARRLLAWLRVRAGFELAAGFEAKGDAAREALCRAIGEAADLR